MFIFSVLYKLCDKTDGPLLNPFVFFSFLQFIDLTFSILFVCVLLLSLDLQTNPLTDCHDCLDECSLFSSQAMCTNGFSSFHPLKNVCSHTLLI